MNGAVMMPVGSLDFYIEKQVSKMPLHNMHHHRSFELYLLVKGQREYFIEDRFFSVDEGDLVFIPRTVFHRTAGEGGLRFLVHFSEAFLEKYFTTAALHPLLENLPFVYRGEENQRVQILSVLNAMLAESDRADDEQTPVDELLVAVHLYRLLFIMTYGNNTYRPQDYADERITQIIQYINENYNNIADIEVIAQRFYISKYHLCRFFKKNLGITLISYLNTIKIRQACAMIKNGCTNLTEVAMGCGFNSSSYFCKVFKKEKGISPTEYRRRHR